MIINFVIQPLFYLSGALFPLNDLPKVISFITNINPLSYGIDGLRGALTGISHFSPVHNLLVLSFVLVVILGVGVYQFSKIEV